MAPKRRSASLRESSVPAKRAKKSGGVIVRHRPDDELDFSDIPELTTAQLNQAKRVGRPTEGRTPKQLIALRIDPDVLAALRQRAAQQKIGYQTLIQRVLAAAVQR